MGNIYVCVCVYIYLKNHNKSTNILVIPMITVIFHLLLLLFSFIFWWAKSFPLLYITILGPVCKSVPNYFPLLNFSFAICHQTVIQA